MSLLLYPNQYIHIQNNDTAEVRTVVGPARVELAGNEELLNNGAVQTCTVVTQDDYIVIKNPYDRKLKKCIMGEREVFVGPDVIALNYGEAFDGGIKKVHVLRKNQALRLLSLKDHENKPAGLVWQVEGPCRFVPNKYTTVQKTIDAILINENEGIYVIDTETSQKKLVKGPAAYLLASSEELYNKPYTSMEISALGLPQEPTFVATVIKLQKGEVVCVLDAEKNEQTICGPESYILNPEEHVKCLHLSAGKPKRPKQIIAAKIKLGPDFMSDKFDVRTKDNAQLNVHLTYKWEFILDPQDAWKIFSLPDFIGYAATTLCAQVREEAAGYTFEQFHAGTVSIIRKVLFKEHVVRVGKEDRNVTGTLFDEIQLLISEVDVKEVSPVSEEINSLLNQSIKSNMIIVCNKMEQEANRDAEKQKIKAQSEIQKIRETLIDIVNENERLRKIEKARIEGQALIENAKAEKEATSLKEQTLTQLELERMQKTIALLTTEGGSKLMELMRAENFAKIPQSWYVASDSKVNLPV